MYNVEMAIFKPASSLELLHIISEEMAKHGDACDLNHIDVSGMTDLNRVFQYSSFNGDISKWDTSNVTDMSNLFSNSKFQGDISKLW